MSKIVKLGEIAVIEGGQILKRVTADESAGDSVVCTRGVIVPKAISGDGTISLEELSSEKFKVELPESRVTRAGDIVIKLSTPYDSAIITRQTENLVVPSFCAVIRRNPEKIDLLYLQAFLSGTFCREQLKKMVESSGSAGTALLTIGKLGEAVIALPTIEKQREIGMAYKRAQELIVSLKEITRLENEKLDLEIKELFSDGEQ